MPKWPGFIGGSDETQSVIAGNARTMNLYVEPLSGDGAENGKMLLPVPGYQTWATTSDVGSRGFCFTGSRLFGVIGPTLYEFDSSGAPTVRGAVVQDSNPAQLAYNGMVGNQLGIASGGNFYCYDLTANTLTLVLSGECTMLGYAHGYFLAFNGTTGKVRLSNLNDGTTWDAGTFFQRSLFADPWQAMFVDGNSLIWLPGTETFEVWYDTGSGTQPFAPLSGMVGRHGIAAPFAFALAENDLYWLERTANGAGALVGIRGAGASSVSTFSVDTAFARYQRTARITDTEILVYHDSGHTFANLSLPTVGATWSYDLSTQSWAERGRWNPTTNSYQLWSPRVHVYAFGKHLIGDRTSGIVAEMSTAFSTELDGTGIRCLRRTPVLTSEHRRIPLHQLELHMDVGIGLAAGQGSNPQIMLALSSDGGRTFGNQRQAGTGRIGEYRRRVYWTRLGAPAMAVAEVSWSEPVPLRIVDAYLNNLEGQQAA